jgi:hypothetical protein
MNSILFKACKYFFFSLILGVLATSCSSVRNAPGEIYSVEFKSDQYKFSSNLFPKHDANSSSTFNFDISNSSGSSAEGMLVMVGVVITAAIIFETVDIVVSHYQGPFYQIVMIKNESQKIVLDIESNNTVRIPTEFISDLQNKNYKYLVLKASGVKSGFGYSSISINNKIIRISPVF